MARTRACIAAMTALLHAGGSLACTIVAVGRDASATGSPIVSHTDDSGPDTTDIRFVRVPRRRWPEGSMRPLHNWGDGYPRVVNTARSPEYAPVNGQEETPAIGHIPQVRETYAYWDMDYGVQNEWGLSIGESTCTARTVGWPATPDKPYGYNRAGIEDLSKLALERCKTARCAVQLMGDVAVAQGFYSADSGAPEKPDYSDSAEALVVGDASPGDLWIFNVMTGRNNASAIWAAQRVPPNHVAAVGNSFTIRRMNLSDPDNFLASPGVTSLAEEQGWWDPAKGEFDFFGAYGYTPDTSGADPATAVLLENTLAFYSGRRMWRIFSLLSPAEGAKLDPNRGNLPRTVDPYPGSVPAPKGSVTTRMVMDVLRDHYEGTPYDLTKGMAAGPFGSPNRGPVPPLGTKGLWERAISMHRGSWSYVLEANPRRRSVSWLGLDSAHGTVYLPFMGAATQGAPDSFHSHKGCMANFSTEVAWWAFNVVNQYSDLNFALINKAVREKARELESKAAGKLAAWNTDADDAGEEGGLELLTAQSNAFAEEAVKDWWKFAWSLFAKYGRYTVTHNESAGGEELQRYPEWWLKSPEVGYTLWQPQGPFHGIQMHASASAASALPVMGPGAFSYLVPLAAVSVVGFLGYQVGTKKAMRRALEQDFYVAQP